LNFDIIFFTLSQVLTFPYLWSLFASDPRIYYLAKRHGMQNASWCNPQCSLRQIGTLLFIVLHLEIVTRRSPFTIYAMYFE